jgi:hypothetical protein
MSRDEEKDESRALSRQQAGTVARREFGASEIQRSGETASSVMAAQAEAMIKASFTMAIHNPRDWDDVRLKLLKACERKGFAEGILDPGEKDAKKAKGAAWYNKPVGQGVQGFSIRFAEEAVRAMRNISVQTLPVYDDDEKRILIVDVVDLENNIHYPGSIVVEKTVERRNMRPGDDLIRTRQNKQGELLHILRATDDEILSKQNNLISKSMRNSVLRLLPGDIQAECRARILQIRQGDIAKDPDKARRDITDGFGKLNVMPSALKEYLGHDLGTATPAEIADLRDLFKAIKDGDITWHDALAQALYERDEEPSNEKGKTITEKMKQDREKREAKKKPESEQPATKETAPPPAEEDARQREPGEEDEGEEGSPESAEQKPAGPVPDRKQALEAVEGLMLKLSSHASFKGNTFDLLQKYSGVRKVAKIEDAKLNQTIDGLTAELEGLNE